MKENPQKENGFTGIANEIVEAMSRTYLTSYETRILWVIFRKTYGWDKKEDWVSISQFVELTGIHRSHVSRSLRLLVLRNIVTKRGNKISFNKYWSQWKELPNGATDHSTVTKRGPSVTKRGTGELPNGAYTKETPTKETITTERATKEDRELAELLMAIQCRHNPAFLSKYSSEEKRVRAVESWAGDIEKLRRLDGATGVQIRFVLDYLGAKQTNTAKFWLPNVQSGTKLRKQWVTIVGQIKRENESKPKVRIIS